MRNSFNDSQETLVTIAADTGGKAMLDTNDLTHGHPPGAGRHQ